MKALYPGTFDPVTNGHIDIIERASKIFEEVIVAVAANLEKTPLFNTDERLDMLRQSCSHLKQVRVNSLEGLLVDCVRDQGVKVIVKGLRAVSDFEYEFQMAAMNRQLAQDVDTVFMMTSVQWQYLSSSIVKEIAMLDGDVNGLVPGLVAQRLGEKVSERRG